MNNYVDNIQGDKSLASSSAGYQEQSSGESAFQLVDNRPHAIAISKLQDMANNSPQAKQAAQLQAMADNFFVQRNHHMQKKENEIVISDNLKPDIESLSACSMDEARVHYDSNKPAQPAANAYAQRTDIYLASGQEKSFPHEARQVVKQKQGRLKPTMKLNNDVNMNDDAGLEKEAEVMGAKAISTIKNASSGIQLQDTNIPQLATIQRNEQNKPINYTGSTVGVEQEISSGPKIRIPNAKNRGIQGYVSKDGEKLVEYTSDLGCDIEKTYTIELRTTPTEMTNIRGKKDRKDATSVMIDAIREAGKTQDAVKSQDSGGFTITIIQNEHAIIPDDFIGPDSLSFANQASIGIQTEDLVADSPSPEAKLILDHASWYERKLEDDLQSNQLEHPQKAQKIYSIIASTIIFLAKRITKYSTLVCLDNGEIQGDLYNSAIKNSWGVLPRTAVWDWLDVLTPNDKNIVQVKLKNVFSNNSEPPYTAAYKHIVNKLDLTGHRVPASTIAGKQASVFEFRDVPQELRHYLYETPDMLETLSQKEKSISAALRDDIKKGTRHLRRPDSDSEDSDDDWRS